MHGTQIHSAQYPDRGREVVISEVVIEALGAFESDFNHKAAAKKDQAFRQNCLKVACQIIHNHATLKRGKRVGKALFEQKNLLRL